MTKWFEADKAGLNKQAKERGTAYIIVELISNALDERLSGVTEINVSVSPVANKPLAEVVVEDNSPRGYGEYLHHAYTLFAESYKRSNPLQSGQFNFGCKLWLSLCKTASISTTTGTVSFDEEGRHFQPKKKREVGTKVEGLMEMTREEFKELEKLVHEILIPEGVNVVFNGLTLIARTPVKTFEAQLPTKVVDDEGVMRPTTRKTTISLYEPRQGETPTLYEMAVPVVETDIRWHVQIAQRVPLNKDRDNVTPAYHQKVRTVVADHMVEVLDEQDAGSWCNDVLADKESSLEVRKTIIEKKFGERAAVFDPHDQEANIRWQSQFEGSIVHGRSLTKEQWENVREFDILKPAGKLTPTAKPWSDDPNAKLADFYEKPEWTKGMQHVADYVEIIAKEALGISDLEIKFAKKMNESSVSACYARRGTSSGLLEFNMSNLGFAWFNKGITVEVDRLLIHELAHHFVGSHHNKEVCAEVRTGMFYDACCHVGASVKALFKTNPKLLEGF